MRKRKESKLNSAGNGSKNELGAALPWEYERVLIQRIQNGDRGAEPAIVCGYRRLVYKLANRLLNPHARKMDLLGDMRVEGQVAVVRAARGFNLGSQNKFYPYCKQFVYLSMWTVSLDYFSAMGISAGMLKTASKIRAGLAALGSAATPDEIAEFCEIHPSEVRTLWSASNMAMRYDQLEEPDAFPDSQKPAFEYTGETRLKFLEFIKTLNQCERDCVAAVYAETEPVEMVAEEYCIEESDVREIARDVIDRFSQPEDGQARIAVAVPSSISKLKQLEYWHKRNAETHTETIEPEQLALFEAAS